MKKIFASALFVLLPLMAVNAHPSRLYLIGSATAGGWSLDNATLMVTESDGIYEWIGDLNDGELKFLETQNWMPSYGPATNGEALSVGTVTLVKREEELEGNDNKYLVAANRYSLHIDLTGETPQLTIADGTGLADKGYTTIYPETIYAIGDATIGGWSLDAAAAMTETTCNSGIYKAQLTLQSGQLKFLHQRNWGKAYGAAVADTPVNGEGEYDMGLITGDDNDNKFAVSLAAQTAYYVTVNAATNKLTLSLTDTPASIENVVIDNEIEGIYDLQGRMVGTSTIGLPAGLYILKGTQNIQKIVIR